MRVLIGYDGSDLADAALMDLHRAGLPPDVEVVVLCVADMVAVPGWTNCADSVQSHLAAAVEHLQQRVAGALARAREVADRGAAHLRNEFPRWNVSAEAVADSPGWAILKRAEGLAGQPWRADLIVVGAAGHSGISRVFLGSVAHKVLTNARCSTRIGRAGRLFGDSPVRLLVGVDGSDDSRAAISTISQRIWPEGTECHIVTVIDMRVYGALPLIPQDTSDSLFERAAREAALTLSRTGLKTTTVVKQGEPARTLIKEAEELGADCIIIGARGLGRVGRFLLGSVSSSVAMRASCTVEVIHPG